MAQAKGQKRPTDEFGRPATFDHLSKKRPRSKTVPIVMDEDVADRYSQLRVERDGAKQLVQVSKNLRQGDDAMAELEAKLERLEAELEAAHHDLEEATVYIRFEAIGRKAYDKLEREHAPSDEVKASFTEKFGGPPSHDPETFAPVIIAASAVQPTMTLEQVEQLFEEWNDAEIGELYKAALSVNTTRREVELGNGRGPTRGGAR